MKYACIIFAGVLTVVGAIVFIRYLQDGNAVGMRDGSIIFGIGAALIIAYTKDL